MPQLGKLNRLSDLGAVEQQYTTDSHRTEAMSRLQRRHSHSADAPNNSAVSFQCVQPVHFLKYLLFAALRFHLQSGNRFFEANHIFASVVGCAWSFPVLYYRLYGCIVAVSDQFLSASGWICLQKH